MAAQSYSIARGGSDGDLGQTGADSVTVGTLAPGAGDVEVRLSSAALAAGMSDMYVRELLLVIWRTIISGSGIGFATGPDFPNL